MLAVFSQMLDEDAAAGYLPPRSATSGWRVLDAGCGVGVIGICAASAIAAVHNVHAVHTRKDGGLYIRCQDRDELARQVTLHNASLNNIAPSVLEAYTEPLLAGPPDELWDLILTNIPAKAGAPVLKDFIRRSVSRLQPAGNGRQGGRVFLVVVHTLADFFREHITAACAATDGSAELFLEKKSPGHSVFVYGRKSPDAVQTTEPVTIVPGFLSRYPFYVRAAAECVIEDIPVRIETIHGASGFDAPGGAVLAAAKLVQRIGSRQLTAVSDAPFLVHEPGQGFFPCWLIRLSLSENTPFPPLVLSGRNILALEAARHNASQLTTMPVSIVTAVDVPLGDGVFRKKTHTETQRHKDEEKCAVLLESAGGRKYSFIAAFPELLPQKSLPIDQLDSLWNALSQLLTDGGICIAAFGSSDAERFDRKKPAGFSRLGSIKRKGFRALAYRFK